MDIYQTWTASSSNKVRNTWMPSQIISLKWLFKPVVVSKKVLETFMARNQTWIPITNESNDSSSKHSSSPNPNGAVKDDKVEDKDEASKSESEIKESLPTNSPNQFSMPEIICEHGLLEPSKAGDMKCINRVCFFHTFVEPPDLNLLGGMRNYLKLQPRDFSHVDN